MISLATLAVGALVLAGWLFLDRDRALHELSSARARMAELRQTLAASELRMADLEAGLEDQQAEVRRQGREIARCSRALGQLHRAWRAVVRAIRAAGALDAEEARAFTREANRKAAASLDAAGRCG